LQQLILAVLKFDILAATNLQCYQW